MLEGNEQGANIHMFEKQTTSIELQRGTGVKIYETTISMLP